MKHVSLWGPWRVVVVLVLAWLIASPALADEPPPAPLGVGGRAGSAAPAPRPQCRRPPPVSSRPATPPAWEKSAQATASSPTRREVPGSPLIAVKGEGIVNASIIRVASVLVIRHEPRNGSIGWSISRVVREVSETETIHSRSHRHAHRHEGPRDFVTRAKLEFHRRRQKVTVNMRSTTDSRPHRLRSRRDHAELLPPHTSIEHGTGTHVSVEVRRSQRIDRQVDRQHVPEELAPQHHHPAKGAGRQARHQGAPSIEGRVDPGRLPQLIGRARPVTEVKP